MQHLINIVLDISWGFLLDIFNVIFISRLFGSRLSFQLRKSLNLTKVKCVQLNVGYPIELVNSF